MSILDIFKKSSKETEDKIEEKFEKVEKNEQESIDINIEETDTLNEYRCNELISHVLKDKDFGEEFIRSSSIRENIFITVYMRNALLKQFESKGIEDLHDKFLNTIELFERILFEKVMKCDRVWKIINKETGSPVIDANEEHILVSELYKDDMIEDLKKCGIIAEPVEMNHDQFVNELNDLYRTGYKGMRFTDGRQTPCVLKREKMLEQSQVKELEYPVNPETYFALAAYLQEFRRCKGNSNGNKSLNILGRVMISNLIKTKFIIPMQQRGENQFNLPIYQAEKDKDGQVTSIGLYVFTDEVEMKKLKKIGVDLDDGWVVQINEFKDIIDKIESCNISEVCVNFASTQFRLNRKTLDSLKKDAGIVSQQDQLRIKQEKFESEELPKIFDKDVQVVRAPNGMPVFMREESRVCINNYIINTLVKKNMFDDAINAFFEDENINTIKVFDVQTRNADIVIDKKSKSKTGTFIMPMRYTDENDKEEVNDKTIHYTENSAKIENFGEGQQEVKISNKKMNFYTIMNSGNQKTYLPLFNSAEEVRKIFPENKFRLCKVTYEDVKQEMLPYDGVVIGPTTLSTIIPKELAFKICDIIM